ncbi:MAG: hypothetical protein PHR40_03450 [Bacteroidales bacterium]|nr:hypothetical protein [Bacteroidales bacterium]
MPNENKISEIKIIIDGLLKDIDSLSETEMVSYLKWEEILMSASLITLKLNTLRIEQERNHMKSYLLKEDANNQFDSNDHEFKRLAYTISQLKSEMAQMRSNISKSIIEDGELSHNLDIDKELLEQLKAEPLKTTAPEQPSDFNQQDNDPIAMPEEFHNSQTESQVSETNSEQNELDFLLDKRSLMDIEAPLNSNSDWMEDMPGQPVDDLRMAVTLNDKLFFIRELFNGDEGQYRLSMEKLNNFKSFSEALQYTRAAFEEWDQESEAVYRFYMILRRRYDV